MSIQSAGTTAKPAKRTNGKKMNLKLNYLSAKKNPRGGAPTSGANRVPGPSPDGRGMNHNEIFVAEVS